MKASTLGSLVFAQRCYSDEGRIRCGRGEVVQAADDGIVVMLHLVWRWWWTVELYFVPPRKKERELFAKVTEHPIDFICE